MKKAICGIFLIFMVSKGFAVTISDIPTVMNVALTLVRDASDFYNFASQLKQLSDVGFSVDLIGSTQTVALSNAQKQGLLAQYQNLKQRMANDFALLP